MRKIVVTLKQTLTKMHFLESSAECDELTAQFVIWRSQFENFQRDKATFINDSESAMSDFDSDGNESDVVVTRVTAPAAAVTVDSESDSEPEVGGCSLAGFLLAMCGCCMAEAADAADAQDTESDAAGERPVHARGVQLPGECPPPPGGVGAIHWPTKPNCIVVAQLNMTNYSDRIEEIVTRGSSSHRRGQRIKGQPTKRIPMAVIRGNKAKKELVLYQRFAYQFHRDFGDVHKMTSEVLETLCTVSATVISKLVVSVSSVPWL